MPPNDQDAVTAIRSELGSGESICWAARPSKGVIFHKEDWYLVPFSLLWGGFAIFWELGVSGFLGLEAHRGPFSWFMIVWGIPFVLIGQYMIWGRFVYSAWKKGRTYYAITDRRVIVVQEAWKRQIASAYLDTLPTLVKEGGTQGIGSLRFAETGLTRTGRRGGWGTWDSMSIGETPAFRDIEDPDAVYRLVTDLREKARSPRATF